MKDWLLLITLLLLEAFLILVLFSPMFHDSKEKGRVVFELSHNPSVEARSRLDEIHRREGLVELGTRSVIVVLIVAVSYGIVCAVRRLRA